MLVDKGKHVRSGVPLGKQRASGPLSRASWPAPARAAEWKLQAVTYMLERVWGSSDKRQPQAQRAHAQSGFRPVTSTSSFVGTAAVRNVAAMSGWRRCRCLSASLIDVHGKVFLRWNPGTKQGAVWLRWKVQRDRAASFCLIWTSGAPAGAGSSFVPRLHESDQHVRRSLCPR
jgi:hypothetical protein